MLKSVALSIIIILNINPAFAGGDVLAALQKKIKYLNERQAVISSNIANSDTPGYKAKDLEPLKFDNEKRNNQISIRTTSKNHISPSKKTGRFKVQRDKTAYETSPDGNNVVIEQQMVNLSENSLEHQEAIKLFKKMNGIVSIAIGDGRN